MKLKDSEVLLLSQLLFHVRSLPDQDWSLDQQIEKLYNRLCTHLVPSYLEDQRISRHQSNCTWDDTVQGRDNFYSHNDESEGEDSDEQTDEPDLEQVTPESLIELDQIKALAAGVKFKFLFEKGSYKSTVDVSLDDGDRIMCDVEKIVRHAESFSIICAEGEVFFDVHKFPKSWTSLLAPGVTYEVKP